MNFVLELSDERYERLIEHLLPPDPEAEEAAFLFAASTRSDRSLTLRVVDEYLVPADEFRIRTLGHLDLLEGTHQRVIRHAHELDAALVEVHSHPYHTEGSACFSASDRAGLADVVPHVMWRLPGRPYTAVVIAPEGLDALVWTERQSDPQTLDAVLIERRRIVPTGYTLKRGWRLYGSV